MTPVLGEIEELVADLYPYRWPISIGLGVAFIVACAFAYWRGWHLVVWRHKVTSAVVLAASLAVLIPAGDYFLSPLWERSHLEEASPLAAAAAEPSPGGAAPSPGAGSGSSGARITRQGEFRGADDFHFGRGKALLIETAPGEYMLRFEEFSVRNGPDLFVYLSPNPDGFDDSALDLGGLKATDGAFNYEVPAGTDVTQFKSAIVWCKRFSVLFAVAPLSEV